MSSRDARKTVVQPLGHDETGATAVEYALLAALIAGVIVTALLVLGPKVSNLYFINKWT